VSLRQGQHELSSNRKDQAKSQGPFYYFNPSFRPGISLPPIFYSLTLIQVPQHSLSDTLTMPSVLVIVRPSTKGKKRIEEIRDWLLNEVKTNEPWISTYESWWTPSVEVKGETDMLILFK
jgi:hypothetical protein